MARLIDIDVENPQRVRRPALNALRVVAVATLVSLVGLALSAGDGEPAEVAESLASTLDGVYTAEQVENIGATYSRDCASCHGNDLGGSGMAPPLKGLPFMFFWEGKSVAELYTFTHDNMPLGNAGSLSDQAYADLVALVLSSNGFPPGESPLEPDVESLAQLIIAPVPVNGGE